MGCTIWSLDFIGHKHLICCYRMKSSLKETPTFWDDRVPSGRAQSSCCSGPSCSYRTWVKKKNTSEGNIRTNRCRSRQIRHVLCLHFLETTEIKTKEREVRENQQVTQLKDRSYECLQPLGFCSDVMWSLCIVFVVCCWVVWEITYQVFIIPDIYHAFYLSINIRHLQSNFFCFHDH